LHEPIGLQSKLQWIVPVWVPEGAVPLWIFEEIAKRLQIAVTALDVNMLRRVPENAITTRMIIRFPSQFDGDVYLTN
jgi:hypothetical protein